METESKKQTENTEPIKLTWKDYGYLFFPFLLFLFFCLFGALIYEPEQEETPQSTQETVCEIQDSIRALQNSVTSLQDSVSNILANNLDLNLQMKVNNLENEVKKYRDDFRHSVDDYNDKMDQKRNIIAIIMGVLGVAFGVLAPWFFNSHAAENAEKARKEAETAKAQLKEAKKTLENIKESASHAADDATKAKNDASKAESLVTTYENKIIGIQKNINQTSINATNAINKAIATQFFIQALQESDDNRAIKLYTDCINMNEGFAEAYNNRGFLMHKHGASYATEDIIKDYSNAITLFENENRGIYAEAYNNRGILFFENEKYDEAEKDFNSAIALNYPEAYLNLGLLEYRNGNIYKAPDEIDKAIDNKHDFAEAYYIKGLMNYYGYFDFEKDEAIKDIIKAKEHKTTVVEDYPNRSLLSGQLKDLDNSFNGVEYSKDMTKLIHVPEEKKGFFIIPFFVEEIENFAFHKCININKIIIPKNTNAIGDTAFFRCTGLKEIIVDKNNPNYCSDDGVLFTINKTKLIAFSSDKASITIPDSVNEIGYGAFWFCTNLKEIHLVHKSLVDFSEAFEFLNTSIVTIYVPKGLGNLYWNYKPYDKLKHIIKEV